MRSRTPSRSAATRGRWPRSTPGGSKKSYRVPLGDRAVSAIPAGRSTSTSHPDILRSSSAVGGKRGQTPVGTAVERFGVRPRFRVDEGPRRDTSLKALAKLKPAFHAKGTVTAGNSSQTSDGAAAVVVMSGERMRELGLTRLGRFVGFATAGVEPERFGIGPVPAVHKVLEQTGLALDQIDSSRSTRRSPRR